MHRLTGVIAFAHGDIVVGAVFVAVLVVVGTMPVGSTAGVGTSVALLRVAVAAGALLSVAVYVVAVRPFLPGGDVIGWVAGGLAAGCSCASCSGCRSRSRPTRCPTRSAARACSAGRRRDRAGAGVRGAGVGLAVGVAVERGLALTGAGAVVRAVSDDARAAALLGIRPSAWCWPRSRWPAGSPGSRGC